MPALKRTFRKGYFAIAPENVDFSIRPAKAILWGANLFCPYDCGAFEIGGKSYRLVFTFLARENLPDTQGLGLEHIDMDITTTERIVANPLAQKVLQGIEVMSDELNVLAPAIKAGILLDIENDMDQMTAMLNHIYGMTNEFMGHTLEEVLGRFPSIMQPIIGTDEDGNEAVKDNVWACIPLEEVHDI